MIRGEDTGGRGPDLEGLARTFLLSASHHVRKAIIEKQFSDVVAGWKRMAVFDGRACIACGSMGGQEGCLSRSCPRLPEKVGPPWDQNGAWTTQKGLVLRLTP